MQIIHNLGEIGDVSDQEIRSYIARKATELMEEYHVDTLDNLCAFVLLEQSESQMFHPEEMEFVETLEIGSKVYLHGFRILGDSYGEDMFLPVEAVRK